MLQSARAIIATASGNFASEQHHKMGVTNKRIHAWARNETTSRSLLEQIKIPHSSDAIEDVIALAIARKPKEDLEKYEKMARHAHSRWLVNYDPKEQALEYALQAHQSRVFFCKKALVERISSPVPDTEPGPSQKTPLEFKDPNLTNLHFCKMKIMKHEEEFVPMFNATSKCLDLFFGLIDDLDDKQLVARLRKWANEYNDLYYNFEVETRVVDRLTDDDFKLLKKWLNQIKYVFFLQNWRIES